MSLATLNICTLISFNNHGMTALILLDGIAMNLYKLNLRLMGVEISSTAAIS